MRAFHSDQFAPQLPDGHRFPMDKYAGLRRRIEQAGPQELSPAVDLRVARAATPAELELVHAPEYVAAAIGGRLDRRRVRELGFPWSPALVERSRRSVGGTIEACQAALDDGVAAQLAGGTHHATRDRPQGYCMFNDAAVAARAMQRAGRVRRVVVIDCDVHQGNGTAELFADDPTVFTFSIHSARNFPFEKPASDLDVALADGTGDDAYLDALAPALDEALERAAADLAIYVAGVDPFAGDRLGRLSLSAEGLEARDERVLRRCDELGLPVAVVMAGGYAPEVAQIVELHFQTIRVANHWATLRG